MSVYAISDLHGMLNLYQEVKKFLKPEDKVYCLGDCGDRGPSGWATIKAVASDPQFEYIMGNHEHMLVHAMQEYLDGDRSNCYEDGGMFICAYNGGQDTFDGWINEGADRKWLHYLKSLPYERMYLNKNGYTIYLSHAGCTGGKLLDRYDLVWDRTHLHDDWPKDRRYKTLIIIHGHTPVQYLNPNWHEEDGIITYCDGHKIDIDCGSYYSGLTCLLNLDTFEEHYFSVE